MPVRNVLIIFSAILIYRMIKSPLVQSDILEFNIPSPFLTQPFYSDFPSPNDQPSPNHPATACKTTLTLTNISFQDQAQDPTPQSRGTRIHGKQGIKKISQAHFLLMNQRKKPLVNNLERDSTSAVLKKKIQLSAKKLQKSKSKAPQSDALEIRSSELNLELQTLQINRKYNEKIEKKVPRQKQQRLSIQVVSQPFQEGNPKAFSSVIELQPKDAFQKINRRLQSDQSKLKQKNSAETGFYKKLKQKLESEMRKLEDKQKENKENLVVEGCRLHRATKKIDTHRRSLTDRPRPNTSVSRTGLQFKKTDRQKDRRPKTSRSCTASRKEIEYLSARSDNLFHDEFESQVKRRFKSENQSAQEYYIPHVHRTYNHVSPINKQENYTPSNGEVKKEKMKEKMLSILVQCEHQADESATIQSGLKVFESFTDRMNKGLSHATSLLKGIQNINEQQSQF